MTSTYSVATTTTFAFRSSSGVNKLQAWHCSMARRCKLAEQQTHSSHATIPMAAEAQLKHLSSLT
jgi:hypothetical protein